MIYTLNDFYFSLHRNLSLNMWPWVITFELEVFILEIEKRLHVWIDLHHRQLTRRTCELKACLVETIKIEMGQLHKTETSCDTEAKPWNRPQPHSTPRQSSVGNLDYVLVDSPHLLSGQCFRHYSRAMNATDVHIQDRVRLQCQPIRSIF